MGIILLTFSVDTIYLTSTSTKEPDTQLQSILGDVELCSFRDNHISIRHEWTYIFTCIVNQISHCLWRKSKYDLILSPPIVTYCGTFTSPDFDWTHTVKKSINVQVAKHHRINFIFLIFNFKWVDLDCEVHGITLLAASSMNVFCGKRLPWTVVTPGHEAVLEIRTLSNMEYEFSISYVHCKLHWLGVIYLEYNHLNEMYQTNEEFSDLKDLISGYDYYLIVRPWQRMNIHLLLDIHHAESNVSVLGYDGPGHKSKVIYKNGPKQQFSIQPFLTTSYRAMIRINMLIKVEVKLELHNNFAIECGAKDDDYNILLESTTNHDIACMEFLDVTHRAKKLFIPQEYPLVHINLFSFQGPTIISGEANQNCQYGGIFILENIHRPDDYTYICENIQNYVFYSDVTVLVVFLVWYPGYSRFRLDAKFRATNCLTRYTAEETRLNIMDSLPCQLFICTPLKVMRASSPCTINISSAKSIGTAMVLVKQSQSLHKCLQVESEIQHVLMRVSFTDNWPFGKLKNVSIIQSSLEEFYRFYMYLNRMEIILPYICPEQGSMKQMSARVRILMCKTTERGIVHNMLYNIHPLTSECINIVIKATFYFKSHPDFNTTFRKLTVIQKEGEEKYVGVYIKVDYSSCAEECRKLTYTLTVLQKWKHRIYQYTNPVGTDMFTGYHYDGLHLSISSPQDACGIHSHCTIKYSSKKSVQTARKASTSRVTRFGARIWYFQPERYSFFSNNLYFFKLLIFSHMLIFNIYFRQFSWQESQLHCESQGLSLLQMNHIIASNVHIRQFHFKTASSFGDVMHIGLVRNKKVRTSFGG